MPKPSATSHEHWAADSLASIGSGAPEPRSEAYQERPPAALPCHRGVSGMLGCAKQLVPTRPHSECVSRAIARSNNALTASFRSWARLGGQCIGDVSQLP